jgi:hypothetical protein
MLDSLARNSCLREYPYGWGTKVMPQATTNDDAFSRLPAMIADSTNRNRNEAETRHKVIDFILHDLLAWPRNRVAVEENIHPGFADYILKKAMAILSSSLKQRRKGFISNCPCLTTRMKHQRISALRSFSRTQILRRLPIRFELIAQIQVANMRASQTDTNGFSLKHSKRTFVGIR